MAVPMDGQSGNSCTGCACFHFLILWVDELKMIDEFVPCVALTLGEPAGVGADVVLEVVQGDFAAQLVVVGSKELLQQRALELGIDGLEVVDWKRGVVESHGAGRVFVWDVPLRAPVAAGELNQANVQYVVEMLDVAAKGCIDGVFDAVVTAPVHKGVINDAGVEFFGHTEFFAKAAGVDDVLMLFVVDDLRVALATTHLPLKDVAQAITRERLTVSLQLLRQGLQQKFNIDEPKILVCGLNPHAGEAGHLGREELDVIQPVIVELQQQGMQLIGPVPADTAFIAKSLAQVDAVLAMYHDQALPVVKQLGFDRAVNVTLGLPWVRTSVDHGTALDLAATGKADANSLQMAVAMAINLCKAH